MATYTGVADANGDFTVPFSSNYTGGQKVTVTAEKDGAEKSIELYAPSDPAGCDCAVKFTGTLDDFPNNIGGVVLSGINEIRKGNFKAGVGSVWYSATALSINSNVKIIGIDAFDYWVNAASIQLPETIEGIKSGAFGGWEKLASLELPGSIKNIGSVAFMNLISCTEVKCNAVIPPSITDNTFFNLNGSCIFKVPAASLAAYQATPNWSVFAGQMIGV